MSGEYPRLDPRRVDGETVATWTLVVFTELLLVAGFLAVSSTSIEQVRYVVYPFVWINVGLLGVTAIETSPGSWRHRAIGIAVAVGYYVVLMYAAGNLGGTPAGTDWSLRVSMLMPGWGPSVVAAGPVLRVSLVPFEVIGYAALSYLLYANVLRISRGLLAGALGLVTCVGCTVPILAPMIGLLGGPASGLTSTAYQYSYDIGTVLFVITVGILYASAAGRIGTVDGLIRAIRQ
ncbi:MAG: DUF7546 family protein [Halanaeroarchaeum sp.]